MRPHPARSAPLFAALFALLPAAGHATDFQYQLGMAVSHTDNVGLTRFNPVGDTILSPSLSFKASHLSSSLRYSATGRAQYLHYTQNSYDDEVRGELTGELAWTLIPERLDFVVNDWLTRQPVDVLTNLVPTNQQEVNVFLAGPSLYTRFGETTRGQIDLRYGNTNAGKTRDFNGDRYKAAARLLHDFNPTTSGSLNLDATRVAFANNGIIADYTRYSGYVGFARKLAEVEITGNLGAARIARRTGPSESAPIGQVRLDWRLSPHSNITADADMELGDTAQYTTTILGALGEPTYDGLTNADLAAGPAIFRSRQLLLSYRYQGDRLGFRIYPQYQRFNYLEGNLSRQTMRSGNIELSYLLRNHLTLAVSGERQARDFKGPDRTDTSTAMRLSLIHDLARHWFYRLDVQHRKLDSSTPTLGYDVNEVALAFVYRR